MKLSGISYYRIGTSSLHSYGSICICTHWKEHCRTFSIIAVVEVMTRTIGARGSGHCPLISVREPPTDKEGSLSWTPEEERTGKLEILRWQRLVWMKGQGRGAAALLRPAQVCREACCQSCVPSGGGGGRRRWGSMVIRHENLELEELCSERTEIIRTSAQPPTCRTVKKY